LCLWPETPGRQAEAGDSGPQGTETPVCLAGFLIARVSDDSDSSLE
jgi:hypothetical protein